MNAQFWEQCYAIGVVVVPFMAYSQYDGAGNYRDDYKVGLRFVALKADGLFSELKATLDDFYLPFESQVTDKALVSDTPEGALNLYLTARDAA